MRLEGTDFRYKLIEPFLSGQKTDRGVTADNLAFANAVIGLAHSGRAIRTGLAAKNVSRFYNWISKETWACVIATLYEYVEGGEISVTVPADIENEWENVLEKACYFRWRANTAKLAGPARVAPAMLRMDKIMRTPPLTGADVLLALRIFFPDINGKVAK